MSAALLAGILCCPLLAGAACLYLANGQLKAPDSLAEWVFPRPQPRGESEEVSFAKQSFAERKKTLQTSRWLKTLWALSAVGGAAFWVCRQVLLVQEPALNFKFLLLFYLFFAAAVVDRQIYIIPNSLVGAAAICWAGLTLYAILLEKSDPVFSLLYSLVGFLFGGGALLFCRLVMKNSLGFGDIKIMAVTGAICGFYKTFNILFYGLLICSLYSIGLLITKKADRTAEVPLAPFLFAGLVVANLIAA